MEQIKVNGWQGSTERKTEGFQWLVRSGKDGILLKHSQQNTEELKRFFFKLLTSSWVRRNRTHCHRSHTSQMNLANDLKTVFKEMIGTLRGTFSGENNSKQLADGEEIQRYMFKRIQWDIRRRIVSYNPKMQLDILWAGPNANSPRQEPAPNPIK